MALLETGGQGADAGLEIGKADVDDDSEALHFLSEQVRWATSGWDGGVGEAE